MTALEAQIRFEEGCKLKVYTCTAGHRTIGVGHNLDANPYFRGAKIPDEITQDQADAILAHDIHRITMQLYAAWPGLSQLQGARHDAVVQMAFQLGVDGLLKFKALRRAIDMADWPRASAEALNSKWARQTPNRATRVAKQILTGEYYEIPV